MRDLHDPAANACSKACVTSSTIKEISIEVPLLPPSGAWYASGITNSPRLCDAMPRIAPSTSSSPYLYASSQKRVAIPNARW